PAAIRAFLDADMLRSTGLRLVRLTREDCSLLGPEGVLLKVEACMEGRVFMVMEGVFDPLRKPLRSWLRDRPDQRCRVSGRDLCGEASTTLGEYAARMK
ncbi:unnamed protein product, partial [Discosporangium mesarthrocarpum]